MQSNKLFCQFHALKQNRLIIIKFAHTYLIIDFTHAVIEMANSFVVRAAS